MKTLQEKNEVLGKALSSIRIITASFCRTAADGAPEEEKYDRGKAAFDEIAKVLANVMRRDLFGDEPPKKSWVASEVARTLKMPVISIPGKAAIKYSVDDPELPRLAALIEVDNPGGGKPVSTVGVYIGKELLADMTIYRGKAFALAMVRRALKGAMSKIGKHRRMTANRQSREAAKKEGK